MSAAGAELRVVCSARGVTLALKRAGRWSVGPSFALAPSAPR